MSTILVQTGQCGNQLGTMLLDELFAQIRAPRTNDAILHDDSDPEEELEIFFRPSRKPGQFYARAVCLDTEPKVIHECISKVRESQRLMSQRWHLDRRSAAYRHGGAGNNWAVGYEMCSGEFLDTALDCIRRELEMCDRPPSMLILHSVAGGTGSGLGTRLTEECSDVFPEVSKINVAITPYHFGEVVVQHYNALLGLSKIASSSNGVLLFENEVAQELCKHMKRLERPTLFDINAVIVANLLPAILPKYSGRRKRYDCSLLSDDLEHLCPHPGYKFLDVKTTPQTSESAINYTFDSWNSLLSTLLKMQIRGSPSEKGLGSGVWVGASAGALSTSESSPTSNIKASGREFNGAKLQSCRNFSSVLTLHGANAHVVATQLSLATTDGEMTPVSVPISATSESLLNTLQGNILRSSFAAHYASIVTEPVKLYSTAFQVNGYQRSASIVSNGCTVLPLLQRVTSRAASLFEARAFVHQYERNGLSDADFIEAFRNLGQAVENYKAL